MRPAAPALAACAVALLAACGSGTAAPPSPGLKAPAGYQRYVSVPLGFEIALAPGWSESGQDPGAGVSFGDGHGATLLVHVEPAPSADLATAASALVFELTGGQGAVQGTQAAALLDGRPARRLTGAFQAASGRQELDAVVTLDGGRAWVVALAGPTARVSSDEAVFGRMAADFHLDARHA